MAQKYNIQIIFYKMTRSFAYATAQIVLSSRALLMMQHWIWDCSIPFYTKFTAYGVLAAVIVENDLQYFR